MQKNLVYYFNGYPASSSVLLIVVVLNKQGLRFPLTEQGAYH